jgi:hypothetical protein
MKMISNGAMPELHVDEDGTVWFEAHCSSPGYNAVVQINIDDKELSMSRFDFVKYDECAIEQQDVFKTLVKNLEGVIDQLHSPRPKAIAITKLEEVFMWIGKAIRDDQLERNK